jgi:hypothetical protein
MALKAPIDLSILKLALSAILVLCEALYPRFSHISVNKRNRFKSSNYFHLLAPNVVQQLFGSSVLLKMGSYRREAGEVTFGFIFRLGFIDGPEGRVRECRQDDSSG